MDFPSEQRKHGQTSFALSVSSSLCFRFVYWKAGLTDVGGAGRVRCVDQGTIQEKMAGLPGLLIKINYRKIRH